MLARRGVVILACIGVNSSPNSYICGFEKLSILHIKLEILNVMFVLALLVFVCLSVHFFGLGFLTHTTSDLSPFSTSYFR